jgi:hypothetical protein
MRMSLETEITMVTDGLLPHGVSDRLRYLWKCGFLGLAKALDFDTAVSADCWIVNYPAVVLG